MNISEWMKKYFGKLRSAASLRYAKGSTEKIKPVHRQIEVAALSFYFSTLQNFKLYELCFFLTSVF